MGISARVMYIHYTQYIFITICNAKTDGRGSAGPAKRNTGGSATRSAYTSNYLNWVVFFGNAIRVNAEPL